MKPADRLRRWWKPAQWRDDHPDRPLTDEERLAEDTRNAAWWDSARDLTRTRLVQRRPGKR